MYEQAYTVSAGTVRTVIITLKDLKLSLIIFNKENRSFINILEKIEKWVKEKQNHIVQKEKMCGIVFIIEMIWKLI